MRKQERSVNTLHSLPWRSLVDRNMLLYGALRISPLYAKHWKLYNTPPIGFKGVKNKIDKKSKVKIVLKYTNGTKKLFKDYGLDIKTNQKTYEGSLRMKYPKNKKPVPWLNYDDVKDLKERLLLSFSLTNAMNIETDVTPKGNTNILNSHIQEFLDIEYDYKKKTFYFTPYFIQLPTFPHLFNLLAHRSNTTDRKSLSSSCIDFNDWKPTNTFYKHAALATNVIYMFLSKKRKEIYIGITQNLKDRYSQNGKNGGPNKRNMHEWDFFKFDKLPEELAEKHLNLIEDILIRTFSSIMDSNNDIVTQKISNYKLTNKRIRK